MADSLGEANPEIAQLLNNPEALQEQMEQMQKLMAGLEQFATNPALKGLADSIPGMKEMLEDPEQLAEQASKVSEVMQNLQDPEKLQEMLGGEGGEMLENLQKMMSGDASGMEAMQEAMQKVAQLMNGGGGLGDDDDLLGGLAGLGDAFGEDGEEGGGDDLKARVREQMAQMMNKRKAGAAMDDDEF